MRRKVICFSLIVYGYTIALYYAIYYTQLRELVASLPYPIADFSKFPGQTAYFLLPVCALTVGMAFLCNHLCPLVTPTEGGTAVARLFGIELRVPRRMLYYGLILLLVLDVGFLLYPVDLIALLFTNMISDFLRFVEGVENNIDIWSNPFLWLFYDQAMFHQILLFLTTFFFLRTRAILQTETSCQPNI